MTDLSGNKIKSDRGHINTADEEEMRRCARHLGVSMPDLQRAIDKVGNSVAAVRKELGK